MSNIILNNEPISTEKLRWEEQQTKEFVRELENYGYVMKVDDTIPLNVDKQKQFGRFKVCLDTKYKVYEVYVWEDN